jgi:anti-sigma regulatory factor (Ser/Thr protein kinase)
MGGGPRISGRRWPHTRRRDRHAVYESFALPGGAAAPGAARRALEGVAGRRLSEEALYDARLMVSELATNSVLHGGAGDGRTLVMSVDLLPSFLRVEVADPAGGFDPPEPPPDPTSEGGRGLALVANLASRWGTRRAPPGKAWFELRRPRWL